jgi:hypothetical protein
MRKVYLIVWKWRDDYFIPGECYWSKSGWQELIQDAELFTEYPELNNIKEKGIFEIKELHINFTEGKSFIK